MRASQQWGLGRDRSVRLDRDAAHTSGPGANVSLLFTSGGAPLDLARGRNKPLRGWNSRAYGELSPAPSVRATQRGTSLSWLTVIAPRAAGVAGDGCGDGLGQPHRRLGAAPDRRRLGDGQPRRQHRLAHGAHDGDPGRVTDRARRAGGHPTAVRGPGLVPRRR